MAVDSGTTPESIKRRRAIAEAMLMQGMKQQPIEHWTQGLGQMAESFVGGRMMRRADEREAAERKAARADFLRAFGYGGETPAPDAAIPASKPYGGMRPDGTPDVNVAASHDAAKMPRGLRNNNPLNIEAGAFTQGQPGYTGSDGRFAQFASLDDGTSAASNLLAIYGSKHGINTVNGAVGRWAPAADGNPVAAYSNHVAKALGVDPTAQIDLSNPEIRGKMVQAMAAFENGQPLPQGQAQPQRTAQAGGVNPALIEAMSNPFLPQGFQTIGAAMLSKQMEPTKYGFTTLPDGTVMRTDPRAGTVSPIYQAGPKPTDDMREYEFARTQGYQGSFADFQRDMRKAGATNVNVGGTEKEFDKKMGGHYAENAVGILEAGRAAPNKIATLQQMRDSIGRVYTGTGGDTILNARRALNALGIDMGDISDAEFVQSVGNRIALELRNPAGGAGMPGALSDKDREFLVSAVPGLTKTPEGNAKLIDYMIAMETRNQQVAHLARQYMANNNGRIDAGFYDQLAEWSNANPLFPQAPATPAQGGLGGFTREEIEAEIKRRGL